MTSVRMQRRFAFLIWSAAFHFDLLLWTSCTVSFLCLLRLCSFFREYFAASEIFMFKFQKLNCFLCSNYFVSKGFSLTVCTGKAWNPFCLHFWNWNTQYVTIPQKVITRFLGSTYENYIYTEFFLYFIQLRNASRISKTECFAQIHHSTLQRKIKHNFLLGIPNQNPQNCSYS